MNRLLNWLVFALAIIIASYILPGVSVSGLLAALVTALVLGFINTFVKPVLVLLTLPINIMTLGVFYLVLNTLLIMLASWAVPGFDVASFWWAALFGIVLWLVNMFFGQMFRRQRR